MNTYSSLKQEPLNIDSTIRTFKALAESSRLQIVLALQEKKLTGVALMELTNLSQSNLSHQLRILQDAEIVIARKEGKYVYYTISKTLQSSLKQICNQISKPYTEYVRVPGNPRPVYRG